MEGIFKTFALLLDIDYGYSLQVLQGFQRYAKREPLWQIVPVPCTADHLLYTLLEQNRLDGMAGFLMSDRWIEGLPGTRLPIVNLSDRSAIRSVPTVITDNRLAGRLAASHLIQAGYRHFAFIPERASRSSETRLAGFREALSENGFTPLEPALAVTSVRGATPWADWLGGLPTPCGVFFGSDFLATRIAESLSHDNRRIPQDFGLVGAGDAPSRTALSPVPLTTIRLNGDALGEKAAQLLAALFQGKDAPMLTTIPPMGLDQRTSTQLSIAETPLVQRALAILASITDRPVDCAELARLCGAARRTLEMRFKESLGAGPATIHRRQRLSHGCLLLRNTNLPQDEIALQTGFGDAGHFSAAFHKAYGMTPGAWRRQGKKKP